MTGKDSEEMRVLHGKTETTELLPEQGVPAQGVPEQKAPAQEALSTLSAQGEVGRLQLLEERAQVQVLRQGVGQVQIRKVLRERQEMMPVTLSTEVLEIVVTPLTQSAAGQPGTGQPATSQAGTGQNATGQNAAGQGVSQILLDGQPLEVGRTYEIPLTEERVQVLKQVYPISEVLIRKQAQTTTHQETVTLRHEELEVLDERGLARLVDTDATSVANITDETGC